MLMARKHWPGAWPLHNGLELTRSRTYFAGHLKKHKTMRIHSKKLNSKCKAFKNIKR